MKLNNLIIICFFYFIFLINLSELSGVEININTLVEHEVILQVYDGSEVGYLLGNFKGISDIEGNYRVEYQTEEQNINLKVNVKKGEEDIINEDLGLFSTSEPIYVQIIPGEIRLNYHINEYNEINEEENLDLGENNEISNESSSWEINQEEKYEDKIQNNDSQINKSQDQISNNKNNLINIMNTKSYDLNQSQGFFKKDFLEDNKFINKNFLTKICLVIIFLISGILLVVKRDKLILFLKTKTNKLSEIDAEREILDAEKRIFLAEKEIQEAKQEIKKIKNQRKIRVMEKNLDKDKIKLDLLRKGKI